MSDWGEDEARREFEAGMREDEERALTSAGIAEQDRSLLRRYREFRHAADAVAAAWRDQPGVRRVALIGSLARQPYKEVPRFSPYRRAGIALWHECKDIDLALWLDGLDDLDALRRAKNRALRDLLEHAGFGVADHQIDVFVLEPGSDRYKGRLCGFNQCPQGQARMRRRRLRRRAVPAPARRFPLASGHSRRRAHAFRPRLRPHRPRRRPASAGRVTQRCPSQ